MQNYQNYQVDLSNCDAEPIHIIGQIQPHGFMLVLDKANQIIEQVSENINQFLGLSIENLLGLSLRNLLTTDEYTNLSGLLLQQEPVNPQLISWQGQLFFGFLHWSDNKAIIECEPYTSSSGPKQLKYTNLISHLSQKLSLLNDLQEVSETIATAMADLLAYDRVEVIQFDAEWNSEVIAESTSLRLPSYLGHHFPASDIPAPARALLLKKSIRQIPNVDAQAVGITPYFNPSTGLPTNIIESELRNPSEIHLEYVKNMGVAATISFSILVKGKLWGLISCHHTQPHFIDVWKRQAGELIIRNFANIILSLEEKRDLKQLALYRRSEELIVRQIKQSQDIEEGLANNGLNLLAITESSGAAIFINNQLTTFGATPNPQQIFQLINWLTENNLERMFCTRELPKSIPEAIAYQALASGVLALEIFRFNQEYLLFFKPEERATRIWAGNPEKPVMGTGMRIHPRKSFAKWEEVVRGRSRPWSLNEQEITQTLLKDIIAIQLRNQATELNTLNKELSTAAESLKAQNKQLEDIAWIMSHNLRSPLNNIEGLHILYTEEPNLENAAFVMEHLKLVSENMAETIEDLNVILKTRIETKLPSEANYIADLITKEIHNQAAVIEQTGADVQTDLQEATIHLPKIYAESILHNLISNALKYRSPVRKPRIVIQSWRAQNQFFLSVADNGLGMDLKTMGHHLFGLYRTFHRNENAKGLGLYLIKSQIEGLGGQIAVESELDKGSTFTVGFPLG